MSKKKKFKSFLKQNKVVLAALSGIAAGISLAGILGTEKARKIADTVGSSVNDLTSKLKDRIGKDSFPLDVELKSKRQTV